MKINPNKLRRLPHVFAKILQLPIHSNADVSVQETCDSFRFTAAVVNLTDKVHIHNINIYPGVTKTVIRSTDGSDLSELDFVLWRIRLPESTLPEMAMASCKGGELVVTVPKIVISEDAGDNVDQHVWEGEEGRFIVIQ